MYYVTILRVDVENATFDMLDMLVCKIESLTYGTFVAMLPITRTTFI